MNYTKHYVRIIWKKNVEQKMNKKNCFNCDLTKHKKAEGESETKRFQRNKYEYISFSWFSSRKFFKCTPSLLVFKSDMYLVSVLDVATLCCYLDFKFIPVFP